MTYRIEVTPEFEQDLGRLDPKTGRRILEKVEWIAAHSEALPAPMKHMPRDLVGLRKYRVGDYRVFFWANPTRHLLTLYGVEHRRSAYRDF